MFFLFRKISFNYLFIFLVGLLILHFFILNDFPFFWDAVSKSERASWIYDNNFNSLIVPPEINSGHPPLWITLLAASWAVFGKTIWISRLLLLFVNIGVVYQILRFCKRNFIHSISLLFIFLVLLEPTYIAQTTGLNNDMLLLFFTLLSLNSIIKPNSFYLGLALTGLLFTNLRGIYLFLALGIIHLILERKGLIEKIRYFKFSYTIPILLFTVFCYYQYKTLGWFIINQTEGLNQHRQLVGMKQILLNVLVFIKSFLEYGRIFLLIFLIPLLFKYYSKNKPRSKIIDRLIIMIVVFTIVLFTGVISFSNPFGDRYFMIIFLLAIVLTINLLIYLQIKRTKVITGIVVLGFITGHFWIYPPTISQSWDSSLAYLNIYKVENQMESYIDSQKRNRNDIGTSIPLNTRGFSTFLTLKQTDYYSGIDLDSNAYILLSNIENETKDQELNYIRNNWKLVKTYSRLGVFMSLYSKEKESYK
jgi:4-amino-4-deoxy-L-arabinose transferase-like glycosyltransferase